VSNESIEDLVALSFCFNRPSKTSNNYFWKRKCRKYFNQIIPTIVSSQKSHRYLRISKLMEDILKTNCLFQSINWIYSLWLFRLTFFFWCSVSTENTIDCWRVGHFRWHCIICLISGFWWHEHTQILFIIKIIWNKKYHY